MASSAYIECVSCGGCGPKFGTDDFIVNRQPAKTALDRQEKACIEKAEKLWNRRESQDAALAQDRASQAGAAEVSATTQALIDLLRARDAAGRAKYGVTLDRDDLSHADWLQHMAEEMLDGAGYALAAKRKASQAGVAGGAVPDGWRLVPESLNYDMRLACQSLVDLEAGDPEDYRFDNGHKAQDAMWAAMLAAAPTPAAEREKGNG